MSEVEGLQRRAGFWRRAIAYVIDGLIVWLLAAIVVGIPVYFMP
jgi:uncharacterized RDD family membrane protein YckC